MWSIHCQAVPAYWTHHICRFSPLRSFLNVCSGSPSRAVLLGCYLGKCQFPSYYCSTWLIFSEVLKSFFFQCRQNSVARPSLPFKSKLNVKIVGWTHNQITKTECTVHGHDLFRLKKNVRTLLWLLNVSALHEQNNITVTVFSHYWTTFGV